MPSGFDATDSTWVWNKDSTHTNSTEYQKDLRQELRQYIKQADRHTLKLLQKFIKSLDR